MKLDKRNPFAAWGHEEQKYVVLKGENSELPETGVKFTEKQYVNIITNEEKAYNTVAVCAVDKDGKKLPLDIMTTFFTNNENMSPVELQNYALGFNNELQPTYNSNEELHYYGIASMELENKLQETKEVKTSNDGQGGNDNQETKEVKTSNDGQGGNDNQGGNEGQDGQGE
jgi:hypothetical protein